VLGIVGGDGGRGEPDGPIAPGIEEVEGLDARIGGCGEDGDCSTGRLAEHSDAIHIEVAALGQVIKNKFHIMHGASEGLLEFADEPLLEGTVMEAGGGEGGDETDGRDAVAGGALAPAIVFEAIGVVFVAVKIKDRGRLFHSLRQDYIEIEWIAGAPPQLHEDAGEAVALVGLGYERRFRIEFAGSDGEGTPVFLDGLVKRSSGLWVDGWRLRGTGGVVFGLGLRDWRLGWGW